MGKDSDVIFLAVKPQIAPSVFVGIKELLNKEQLVVSIMAGTTIETIQNGLGLAIVTKILNDHNATIIFNSINMGAEIKITIPKIL